MGLRDAGYSGQYAQFVWWVWDVTRGLREAGYNDSVHSLFGEFRTLPGVWQMLDIVDSSVVPIIWLNWLIDRECLKDYGKTVIDYEIMKKACLLS